MRLKSWCRHVRPAPASRGGSPHYEWFDRQLNAWRPFTDPGHRCPVCGAIEPSMRQSRRQPRSLIPLLLVLILAALILFLLSAPAGGGHWPGHPNAAPELSP